MPSGPWQPSLRRGRGFGPGHGGFGLGFEGKEGFEGEREREETSRRIYVVESIRASFIRYRILCH